MEKIKNIVAPGMIFMLLTLTSCELAGDIFSAGFYTGLFIVLLVLAVIIFVAVKLKGKR